MEFLALVGEAVTELVARLVGTIRRWLRKDDAAGDEKRDVVT